MKPNILLAALRLIGSLKRNAGKNLVLIVLSCLGLPLVHAQGDDLDAYKYRFKALWWFSQPTGYFQSSGHGDRFDLQKDFAFGYYSTFTGSFDWRFTRRQHFLFAVSPIDNSSTKTLVRTITFQGKTYDVGTVAKADVRSLSFAPGYQFDFIRRDHGYVGVAAQMYLLDTRGSITGTVVVNGQSATQTASGSIFAPLPVIGPHARWYPLHDSNRLALEGFIQGMYFFGYGDFWSAQGMVEFRVAHHLNLDAGYQLGTRFSIHGTSDHIGIRMTQSGAVAGIEGVW